MNEVAHKPESSEKTAERMTHTKRALLAVGLPIMLIGSFLLAALLWGICILGFEALGVSFAGMNASVAGTIDAAAVYLFAIFILIGVPFIIWKKPFTSLKELGLERLPSWQDIFLAPTSFVIYLIAASLLLSVAKNVIPGFDAEQVQEVGFEGISQQYEYLLAFATLVVVAPVAEEVLLRGYLYGKLRKVVPMAVAMIITSVVFGALHMQWNVAIDTFVLSMVMVSLREVTGSIWAGILLHMIKNGVAFYFLFVNPSLLHIIGG